MKMKIDISRTCGSVRSSLLALAGLVTVRSEAAETTSLHPWDEEVAVKWPPRLQHQGGRSDRLDDTSNESELPRAPSYAQAGKGGKVVVFRAAAT